MSTFSIPGSDNGSTRQEVLSPDRFQTYQRGRPIKSCLECRRRKMRCSRSQPCQICSRFRRECVYLPSPDWSAVSSSDAKHEDSYSSGHALNDCQDESPPTYSNAGSNWQVSSMCNGSVLETDSGAKHDRLYCIDGGVDCIANILRIGRLKVPERIGGLLRPEVGKRLSMLLASNNDLVPSRSVFRVNEVTFSQNYDGLQSTYDSALRSTDLQPSPGLLLSASESPDQSWACYFPTREVGNKLYYQYLAAVDPLAHVLHKPSFAMDCYYFKSRLSKTQLTPPFKALLLAVYFAAAVSLPPLQCELQMGIQKKVLTAKLKAATEKALIDADYMSSVQLQTLQAFTIYMTPQCREEVTRSHTILVGALLRLAECAGLHRSSSDVSVSPTETQVRRLLWHQICFLDIRTAESQGAQPTIREDEVDTPLPWNVDDTDLDDASRRISNIGWTDATFSLIRYECYMVHRLIFRQRIAPDNDRIGLATVRSHVDQRKKMIKEKYLQHLDEQVPIQRCAKLVGKILTATFDPMLLQSHLQDAKRRTDMENELHNILIKSGIQTCESAAVLETATELAPWAWYAGAYQQYQQAIVLLMEVYRNPSNPYADRINAILDFIFGKAPGLNSIDRNRGTIRLLADECTNDMHLRKVKTAEIVPEETGNTIVSTQYVLSAPPHTGTTSSLHVAPLLQVMDEYQRAYDRQPTMGSGVDPTQRFAAPDMSDWAGLSPYRSSSGNSMNSMAGDFWTDDFQPISGVM